MPPRLCMAPFFLSFQDISRYSFFMKKSLLETNPYLKDPAKRKRLIRRSVVSSFAVEGIVLKEEIGSFVKEDTSDFKDRKTSTSD